MGRACAEHVATVFKYPAEGKKPDAGFGGRYELSDPASVCITLEKENG